MRRGPNRGACCKIAYELVHSSVVGSFFLYVDLCPFPTYAFLPVRGFVSLSNICQDRLETYGCFVHINQVECRGYVLVSHPKIDNNETMMSSMIHNDDGVRTQ